MTTELEKTQKEMQILNAEAAEAEHSHKQEMQVLTSEITEKLQLVETLQSQLQTKEEEFQSQLATREEGFQSQLATKEEGFQNQLTTTKEEVIISLTAKFEAELQNLKDERDSAVSAAKEASSGENAGLIDEMTSLRERLQTAEELAETTRVQWQEAEENYKSEMARCEEAESSYFENKYWILMYYS